MSDQTPSGKPSPTDKPIFDVTSLPKSTDDLKNTAEELRKMAEEARRNAPPEVQQAVEKTIGFTKHYKKEFAYALIGLLFLRLYKRRISKKTAKQIFASLEASGVAGPNGTLYPSLLEIVENLRATPDMAYIPHGGGMVHLLKGRDMLITLFGNFEEMTNDEIWNKVASLLNITYKTP